MALFSLPRKTQRPVHFSLDGRAGEGARVGEWGCAPLCLVWRALPSVLHVVPPVVLL